MRDTGLRCCESGGSDIRNGLVAVHDAIQGRLDGTAAKVSTVRRENVTGGGESYGAAMRAAGIRQERDEIVQRRMGIRRPRKHNRHRGKYIILLCRNRISKQISFIPGPNWFILEFKFHVLRRNRVSSKNR